MGVAGGVGVVAGEGAVADDEELDIFEEAAGCPERIPLVAIDLIEGFLEVHSALLKFNVHKREAVYEDGDIIAVGASAILHDILVDDLQAVAVDVVLVYESDVAEADSILAAVHQRQNLDGVVLDGVGFLNYPVILVGEDHLEEEVPIAVGEFEVIEAFELGAKIGDEGLFIHYREVFIALLLKLADECRFEGRFALVAALAFVVTFEFRYQGALRVLGYDVEMGHLVSSFEGQKLISIVLVLLLTGFDFGGEAGGEVVCKSIKFFEYRYNLILFC